MQHFRSQQVHALLNRHGAITLLQELALRPEPRHVIPRVVVQPEEIVDRADSQAELGFAAPWRDRGFPASAAAQLRVGPGGGDVTVAAWAWPDRKVLGFIDGMSPALHWSPEQRRLDRLRRAKARMQGWRVVEITAEALHDKTSLAVHPDELAVYLG